MQCSFILDFWTDDGWSVGNLREVPNVFSQGKSLEELKTNIQDAYRLVVEEVPNSRVEECYAPDCIDSKETVATSTRQH